MGHKTQVTFNLTLDTVAWPIFSHKSLNIASDKSCNQNSTYGHFEGHAQGHLGRENGQGFFVEIAISLQISELLQIYF